MSTIHPGADPVSTRAKCTARNRQGNRCGMWPVPGATVCKMHGGHAPQVMRKARLRLLELIEPAIATLAREMGTATTSADRQRAANSLLDRAGLGRASTVDVQDARSLLLKRLAELEPPVIDEDPPHPAIEE